MRMVKETKGNEKFLAAWLRSNFSASSRRRLCSTCDIRGSGGERRYIITQKTLPRMFRPDSRSNGTAA
jgi:hypothetical protein